jgi:hypothetical protein
MKYLVYFTGCVPFKKENQCLLSRYFSTSSYIASISNISAKYHEKWVSDPTKIKTLRFHLAAFEHVISVEDGDLDKIHGR